MTPHSHSSSVSGLHKRVALERLTLATIWAPTAVAGAVLLGIVGTILAHGVSAISWQFLSQQSRELGASGGVLYQVLGSLLVVSGAALVAFPLALGTAICQNEFIPSGFLRDFSSRLVYVLHAVPSIVFGLFGLLFFVRMLGLGVSWLSGSLVLAAMILPTLVVNLKESMASIPLAYRESALALGLSKWQVVRAVLLPQSVNGAVTGLLLGLSRALGETAPIMFTATTFTGTLPRSLFEPVPTLPTHILVLAQEATRPQAITNAWGAALVLLIIVILLSSLSFAVRTKTAPATRR